MKPKLSAEGSKEVRLWLKQIILPGALLLAYVWNSVKDSKKDKSE